MTALLELRSATRRFGGLLAVNELSFSISAGETVGLLGPNGSGKTTALNTISALLPVSSGSIVFDGETVSHLKPNRIVQRGIARTFQLVRSLSSLTVGENILAAIAFRPTPAWGDAAKRETNDLLARVGLEGRADQRAGDLTYIDLKRMELARALASQPRLLLLDEWLAGLNPTELNTGIELIETLRQSGMAVLLVEHVMDAVRALCGRSIVMNAGRKIADGPTDEVLRDPEVIRAYLGGDDA